MKGYKEIAMAVGLGSKKTWILGSVSNTSGKSEVHSSYQELYSYKDEKETEWLSADCF